jgi:hypothetical protein
MSCFALPLLTTVVSSATLLAQTRISRTANEGGTLAAQCLAALTHGTAVTDAKLEGNASFTSGADQESGPATLEASGHLESRVALSLSGGSRLLIQNGTEASWSGPDGQTHLQALHNSLDWAVWFFPALAISGVVQDPTYTASYIGAETYEGVSVQRICCKWWGRIW